MPVSMGLPGAEGRGDGVAVAIVRDSMAEPDSPIQGKRHLMWDFSSLTRGLMSRASRTKRGGNRKLLQSSISSRDHVPMMTPVCILVSSWRTTPSSMSRKFVGEVCSFVALEGTTSSRLNS